MKRHASIQIVFLCLLLPLLFLSCSKGDPSNGNSGGNTGNNGGNTGNGAAVFTLQGSPNNCINFALAGTYLQGTALNSSNTVSIQVNVTTTGTWAIRTSAVAGISFVGSGTFTATGIQTIILLGAGTPSSAGPQVITVTTVNSNCNFTVLVTSSSPTLMVDATIGLFFDYTDIGQFSAIEVSGSGYDIGWSVDSTSSIRTKLINARLGVFDDSATTSSFGYRNYFITFSNVNSYTSINQVKNLDTAGKVQLWTYREDGADIIPASPTRKPVNKIIQVFGVWPSNPNRQCMYIYDYDYAGYPTHRPPVSAAILEKLFADARWKLHRIDWTY